MADARKDDRKAPTKPRTTDAPGPRESDMLRNPGGTPGLGRTSAPDDAAPRQKEAINEGQEVQRGFTKTGPSGSSGGRATYGLGEDEEERDESLTR